MSDMEKTVRSQAKLRTFASSPQELYGWELRRKFVTVSLLIPSENLNVSFAQLRAPAMDTVQSLANVN